MANLFQKKKVKYPLKSVLAEQLLSKEKVGGLGEKRFFVYGLNRGQKLHPKNSIPPCFPYCSSSKIRVVVEFFIK